MPSKPEREPSAPVTVGSRARDDRDSEGGGKQGRVWIAALAAILLVALVVRVWGLDFGLPNRRARPDEAFLVSIVMRILQGDPNPHSFLYPSLFLYFLAGMYFVAFLVGRLSGAFPSMSAFVALWRESPDWFLLAGRSVSALLGTANVLVVQRIGVSLFDRRVALLAAFYLALMFLHVSQSHFAVTDVPLTFMISWGFLTILRARAAPSTGRFAWAGVVSGLAAGTKYNGVLLFCPLIVVVAEIARATPGGSFLRRARKPFTSFLIPFGAAFLASTPYALLDLHKFLADVKTQGEVFREGHMFPVPHAWWYHLRVTLLHGLGWPMLAASVLGFVVLAFQDRRKFLLFASFPLAYYVVAGSGATVMVRYVDPLLPFLALGAGFGTNWLAERLARALRAERAAPVAALRTALAVAIVFPSVQSVIAFDRLLCETDSRVLAATWIEEHVPAGATLYLAEPPFGKPEVPEERYEPCSLDPAKSEFTCGKTAGVLPAWIVLHQYPLDFWSPAPTPAVSELLASRYELAAEFTAYHPRAPLLFDEQDAFYLPLSGFDGVERPGPNLSIFRLR